MKLALISDVHGNLQALQAVLDDISGKNADEIAFLGDAVGYGANPNEVVDAVTQVCSIRILGNHDAYAIDRIDASDFNTYAQQALQFTRAVLNDRSRSLLAEFAMKYEAEEALLTHATPSDPQGWGYCLSAAQAARQFDHFDSQACFIGHSHFPVVFSRNGSDTVRMKPPQETPLEPNHKYLINVGSVGQPRDGDPRACYALIDSDQNKLSFRRVPYSIEAAQRAMKERGLPDFLIDRLARGR